MASGITGADRQLCTPTTELIATPWFHALPARERLSLSALVKTFPAKLGHDISQQVFRSSGESEVAETILGTIIPKGKIWIQDLNPPRWVTGLEEMHIQGVPMDMLKEAVSKKILIENMAKEFAGNSYTAVVFAACIIALLIHWPDPSLAYHQSPGIKELMRFLPKVSVEADDDESDLCCDP